MIRNTNTNTKTNAITVSITKKKDYYNLARMDLPNYIADILAQDYADGCQKTIGISDKIHCIFYSQEFPDKSRGFNFQMGP